MRLDRSLPGVMTSGSGMDTPSPDFLPVKVANVSKEGTTRVHAHEAGWKLFAGKDSRGRIVCESQGSHAHSDRRKSECLYHLHVRTFNILPFSMHLNQS